MSAANLTSFQGQVVLVTGAASGIGKAAAELIAAREGMVICLDLNEAGLKTTVAEITAAGGKASYKTLDVSSQAGVKKVIAEILAEYYLAYANLYICIYAYTVCVLLCVRVRVCEFVFVHQVIELFWWKT